MTEQPYFEDIMVGDELPSLIKQPTTRQLVMWAGASGDFNPIHYDQDFARNRGLDGVVVQGQLVGNFLGQLVTDWIGGQGELKKFNCSYKGMNYPGTIVCKGVVKKKYTDNGEHFVECSLWAENAGGEKTVTGTAVVVVPARDASG
ncbi:MaoC/PaaZ C-terminal domain-containing protein [Chloroflexota bacterium]